MRRCSKICCSKVHTETFITESDSCSTPWYFIDCDYLSGFGGHCCTVPMEMHPWMTGMCKQSTLKGAFRRCQPAQWSPLLNAREKGHSSPNCSTKPELPGLYLPWLASMTHTSEAAIGGKKPKAQRKATGQQHARDRNEKETSVKPFLWQ